MLCVLPQMDVDDVTTCNTLAELLVAWTQARSFDDCASDYGLPGFLSAAEIAAQLTSFMEDDGVIYEGGSVHPTPLGKIV